MSLFTIDFQCKILKLFLNESVILCKYIEILDYTFFEHTIIQHIYKIIIDFFKKYKVIPDNITLVQEIKNLYLKDSVQENTFDDYIDIIKKINNLKIDNQEYIENSILTFIKNQAFKKFVLECSENVSTENTSVTALGKMRQQMDDVIRLGDDLNNLGHIYFDIKHINDRIDKRKFGVRYDAIPTGFDYLDWHIGGLCKKEFGFVIGGSGKGKSILLKDFGKNALLNNYTVFHYHLEMTENSMANRYDAAFLGVPLKKLNEYDDMIRSKTNELFNRYKKHLIIKRLKYEQSTVLDIMSHKLQTERALKLKPDLIIVDYGDIMKSAFNKYKDKRNDQIQIFQELALVLAEEADCAVWSATQIGSKESMKKDTAKAEDIAEAMAKVNIANIALSINQTDEELNQEIPKGRIFVVKNRDGEKNKTVYVTMDIKNTASIEWDINAQAEFDPINLNIYEDEKRKKQSDIFTNNYKQFNSNRVKLLSDNSVSNLDKMKLKLLQD